MAFGPVANVFQGSSVSHPLQGLTGGTTMNLERPNDSENPVLSSPPAVAPTTFPATVPGLGGNVVFVDHLGDTEVRVSAAQARAAFDLSQRVRSHDWSLDEVLEAVFASMSLVTPIGRVGLALLDDDGMVVAHRAISKRRVLIGEGYKAPLSASSLSRLASAGLPRLIRDLSRYLADNPRSLSTARIVAEGFRSSLTCPVSSRGRTMGFLFFSSEEPDAFSDADILLLTGEVTPLVAAAAERGLEREQELSPEAADGFGDMPVTPHDLASAKHVQSQMNAIDSEQIRGLDIALNYKPAGHVGGDIIDVVRREDDTFMILVADAMGHGHDSAMVAAAVKGAFRVASRQDASPDEVLSQLNSLLCGSVSMFPTTAVCCLLDLEKNLGSVASAGHYLPVHCRAAELDAVEQGCTGLPLGIEPGEKFPLRRFTLAAADKLAFYTDGVIDALDPSQESYTRQRLIDTLRLNACGSAMQALDGVWRDLEMHCRGCKPHDDMILFIVGWAGPDRTSASLHSGQ